MLHEMIEVIGIFSKPPSNPHSCDNDCKGRDQIQEEAAEGDEDDEAFAHAQAFGSLPRVHAILYHKPSYPETNFEEAKETLALGSLNLNLNPREVAVRTLADALGGDELAAEYLLLLSLERVTSRASDLPLGIAPMNLTGCPLVAQGPGGGPGGVQVKVSSFALALNLALSSLLPLTKVGRVFSWLF